MEDSEDNENENSPLAIAARTLQDAFRSVIADRTPLKSDDGEFLSKKWVLLYLICQMFKIYFRLNALRLCAFLIRTVSNPNFPPFDDFPKSERVTYKYYAGRIAMFDSDFATAQECLDYAFKHCNKKSKNNKRYVILVTTHCIVPFCNIYFA